jgi:antitoxin component YwqK of YwqJK toxin-antitoxin module
MKTNYLPYALILLALTTSCRSCRDDVVCEKYVHRYGVELPPEEWSQRGRHGQVVSAMKDGVVVSRSYESGTLHGDTTYTFPHRDTIQKKECYEQGRLTEEFHNHSDGLPHKQITHNSPNSRTEVIWYDNGSPQCQEQYENNSLVSGTYFNSANSSEAEVADQNGMRVRRDRYGELISVDNIQNGQMVQRTTYHFNGTPQSLTTYVNNKAHGQRRTYLPTGEPSTVEQWQNDSQHGMTTAFEHGQKYAVIPYVYGKKHGVERRYRSDGETVAEKINWVQDCRHGPSYAYINGNEKVTWYFQGRPVVNKQTFDALCNQ